MPAGVGRVVPHVTVRRLGGVGKSRSPRDARGVARLTTAATPMVSVSRRLLIEGMIMDAIKGRPCGEGELLPLTSLRFVAASYVYLFHVHIRWPLTAWR